MVFLGQVRICVGGNFGVDRYRIGRAGGCFGWVKLYTLILIGWRDYLSFFSGGTTSTSFASAYIHARVSATKNNAAINTSLKKNANPPNKKMRKRTKIIVSPEPENAPISIILLKFVYLIFMSMTS